MAFNLEGDFAIDSVLGKGTVVTIRIPKREVMEKDD